MVYEAERQRIEVIDRVMPAVVCVFDQKQRGGGSGVIINAAGYGLTNFHVVAGMLSTRHGLGALSDGKMYDLEVLGIDPTGTWPCSVCWEGTPLPTPNWVIPIWFESATT